MILETYRILAAFGNSFMTALGLSGKSAEIRKSFFLGAVKIIVLNITGITKGKNE
jgi:hypothetical protein